MSRIESHIQGRTLGGLMELVPLLVTAIVLLFIIRYADAFVRPLALAPIHRKDECGGVLKG